MAWGKSGTPKIDFGIAILALQNKIARIITGDIPIAGNGDAVWGGITGTLSAQTDLQTALNLKANTSALSGYLPITGGVLTGTAGNGKVTFPTQSATPATPANGFSLYADATNRLSWKGANGYVKVFDGVANTADRTYTLPDANGTFGLLGSTQTWSGTNTFSQAIRLDGQTITAGVAVASTHKIAINLGGITYYLLASNV